MALSLLDCFPPWDEEEEEKRLREEVDVSEE
jgi:hypothetical protein